jgi:hypothetical protein
MTIAMQPIYTQTVGAGGVSGLTFNNIPQGFTDLRVVFSLRGQSSGNDNLILRFNGSTTGYSNTVLTGRAGVAQSGRAITISDNYLNPYFIRIPNSDHTANTFNSAEAYIPNYTGPQFKSVVLDGVLENNVGNWNGSGTVTEQRDLGAGLWQNTSAISSIFVSCYLGFVQHSTVTIYGITKG